MVPTWPSCSGVRWSSWPTTVEEYQENEAFLIVLSQEDGKLEAAKRYENMALRNPCLAK
jgi:hypothetical protein